MMSMQAERIAQVMRLRSEDLERRLEAGGDADADASVLVGCPAARHPTHTTIEPVVDTLAFLLACLSPSTGSHL